MNKKQKQKRGPVRFVLDIVIGILCVIMVGIAVFTIDTLREDWNYSYDADAFYYRLQEEDFGTMVDMYHSNKEAGVKENQELKQYYGIAEYFEAASYYRAFQEDENEEQMKKYVEKMELAKEQMGELDFVSEMICEKLEIVTE